MLWPQGKPPWVRCMLFVEDIKCMRAGTKNAKTEDNDQCCKHILRKVEGCGVDLHPGGLGL